jgi:hypothetical protein
VIIRHEVGVPGLKKALILLLFLLPASLIWLSCGGYSSQSAQAISGVKNRAFITNSVSAGTATAGVYILNAETDVRPVRNGIGAGNTPGMMVLTPNRSETLVFSGNGTQSSDNQLTILANASETAVGHVTLPGMTESIVVSPDNSNAYAAVPTAFVVGQSPGAVEVVSLSTGAVTAEVDVPAVHYLAIDNSGNRILAFSDNSDSVAVITPSNIGIGTAVTYVGGFDRPVTAFFSSDDSTAYVLNCGAECGGQQAGVQQLSLNNNGLVGASVGTCSPTSPNQCAGSVALLNGSTMYVAGTPHLPGGGPSLLCPAGTTLATYCGLLTVFDLSTMSVTNSTPIIITDGYHNRIALGAGGQLFIGGRICTEIIASVPPVAGAEVRGCLSIYNTQTTEVGTIPGGAVIIPPANGDVTGLQPIATRTVVYVVQGGALNIYDATIDALEFNPNDPNNPGQINGIIGQFVDVKTVDF